MARGIGTHRTHVDTPLVPRITNRVKNNLFVEMIFKGHLS